MPVMYALDLPQFRKNSPLDIFMWNLFVVKYFRPLESPMNKRHYFLFIVKNISCIQFSSCHTIDENFFPNYGIAFGHLGDTYIYSYQVNPCAYVILIFYHVYIQVASLLARYWAHYIMIQTCGHLFKFSSQPQK